MNKKIEVKEYECPICNALIEVPIDAIQYSIFSCEECNIDLEFNGKELLQTD